jgi:hypothetical protein
MSIAIAQGTTAAVRSFVGEERVTHVGERR